MPPAIKHSKWVKKPSAFAERRLDRVEIRRIRRKIKQRRARCFDRGIWPHTSILAIRDQGPLRAGVADSCFSGALFRTSPDRDPSEAEFADSLAKDAERSSRVLIASGGTEPVLDGGADDHFARKFLDALVHPIRPIFSARELHVRRLKPSVSGNVRQVPQYDWLRESGNDTGDFVFVRVKHSQAAGRDKETPAYSDGRCARGSATRGAAPSCRS
jgi:hypothetical protein